MVASGYPQIKISQKSIDNIVKEMDLKIDGIKSIITPYNREQIAKVVFTVAGTAFIRRLNQKAKANKYEFHHIYEWNQVGTQKGRLYGLVRTGVKNGSLKITSQFYESSTPVPISKKLMSPGKNGKSVKSRHIFKNKANVMEDGIPVRIRAKFAGALAFNTRSGLIFIPKKHSVLVKNPGGNKVRNAFTKEFKYWFKDPTNINNAMSSSGYFNKLEKEIAKCLSVNGSGRPAVSATIAKVSTIYSKGLKEL